MKKTFKFLLILIVISLVFVTGCKKKEENTEKITYGYGNIIYN